MLPQHLNTDRLRARGDVRSREGLPTAVARFAWRDAESGERLVVELRGTNTFLAALEACGFERLPEEESEAGDSLDGGRPRDLGPPGSEEGAPRLAIVTPLLRGSA